MEDIQIRTVADQDYRSLTSIEQGENGCRYQAAVFIRQMMTICRSTFLVAESSGKIIGMVLAVMSNEEPDVAWILRVKVCEGYRRQGIGSFLCEKIICILKNKGISHLYLTVSPDNGAAISIYEKKGFSSICMEPEYFGEDEARYVMYCRLE